MYLVPWYRKNELDPILAIEPKDIIVFDVETTGLDAEKKDEILQLSIINGSGEVLFSDYIKPLFRKRWNDAQQIHGISPTMVKEKRTFYEIREVIQDIFNQAKLIVGYNLDFDLRFMEAVHIKLPKYVELFDVMIEYAPVAGKWNDYKNDFKWMKLTQCARHYKYKFEAHDALEDVKATLHCFDKMLNDYEECGYRDLVASYKNSKKWLKEIEEKKQLKYVKSSIQIKDDYPCPNEYTDKIKLWNQSAISAEKYSELIQLEDLENDPTYDEITDEIYHCFLIGGNWDVEQAIGEAAVEKVARKCKEFGGRLFKTKAKSAKFAILKTIYDREYTKVKILQAEGYKVTTWENALKYMGLQELWDIEYQEELYKKQLEIKKAALNLNAEKEFIEKWYEVLLRKVTEVVKKMGSIFKH